MRDFKIHLISCYSKDKIVLDHYEYKSDNMYLCLEKEYKLRGCLNNESFDFFKKVRKARIHDRDQSCKAHIQIDINKAYPSMLSRIEKFPIPIITDKFEKYKYGQNIIEYAFYYCKVTKRDHVRQKRT